MSIERHIKGGSTALCAIARDSTIHVFNVGDSLAAVVGTHSQRFINRQHRPSSIEEQEALTAKGALVMQKKGVWRINGELAISRSFGDIKYKEFINAVPDVYSFDI